MLPPCPSSPNCITSMCDPSDKKHYVEPILFRGEMEEAKQMIRQIIQENEQASLVRDDTDYIKSIFRTKLLRFIDDVDFYFGQQGYVHLRSASRMGYFDLGQNRKRAQEIKNAFAEKAD
ncbi:DUF1499 domain-containing protein [Alteribacillus sp. HJP-4]|uniref:DUF1499 domain-containing protein n=1 Tax=Alteribacillus sp. HJP-4 TaxID=2775394 RepID=UPI0035CCE895